MHRINRTLSKVRHSLRPTNSSTPDATLNLDTLATANDTEQTEPVCINVQGNFLLEKLPPEIRCHILYILGITEIRALVHASPVFHQQYVLDRRSLLSKSLKTTLGDVAVDACAVYQSGWADYEDLCIEDEVVQFLNSYQNRRCLP